MISLTGNENQQKWEPFTGTPQFSVLSCVDVTQEKCSMSYLTIAVDSGTDCNSGAFNKMSTTQDLAYENAPFVLTSPTPDGKQSRIFLWDPSRGVRRPTPPDIDGSPLAERGWVIIPFCEV
jgi:hypothetical protein